MCWCSGIAGAGWAPGWPTATFMCCSRCRRCAGDHLRHFSFCRARTDSADAGPGPRGRKKPPSRWARRALPLSAASPCPTSNGACFTRCCFCNAAPWRVRRGGGGVGPYPRARPTPCRCMLSCFTTITIMPGPLPWRHCWRCWPLATLAFKTILEWRYADELAAAHRY